MNEVRMMPVPTEAVIRFIHSVGGSLQRLPAQCIGGCRQGDPRLTQYSIIRQKMLVCSRLVRRVGANEEHFRHKAAVRLSIGHSFPRHPTGRRTAKMLDFMVGHF
jgi:hypothetical protein